MLGDFGRFSWLRSPGVKAQARDQYHEEKLPSHSLDGRQTSRYIRARHNVAITDRCQSNETKIHRAGAGEIAGESESAGLDLLKNPVEAAKKNPREQIGAESSVDVLAVNRTGAKSESQGETCRNQRNHRPDHETCHSESCLVEPTGSESDDQGRDQNAKQKPSSAAATDRDHSRNQIDCEKQLDEICPQSPC